MTRRRRPMVRMGVSQDATPANPMMIEQQINRARAVADSDIVTQIAALHGGRLGLQSAAGAGTTATLVLPRRREAGVSESSDKGLGAG